MRFGLPGLFSAYLGFLATVCCGAVAWGSPEQPQAMLKTPLGDRRNASLFANCAQDGVGKAAGELVAWASPAPEIADDIAHENSAQAHD